MSNTNLILGNWKANNNSEQAIKWLDVWKTKQRTIIPNSVITLAVPFTILSTLSNHITSDLTLAAQDVSEFPPGRYTGEIPAALLKEFNVKFCLIGHSERRKNQSETIEQIEQKFERLIESGIVPIVCAQTIEDIPKSCFENPVDSWWILYESESAISSDAGYHPEDPRNVSEKLSQWKSTILNVPILYGGSVTPETARDFYNLPQISGLGIGNASLDPTNFHEIVSRLA